MPREFAALLAIGPGEFRSRNIVTLGALFALPVYNSLGFQFVLNLNHHISGDGSDVAPGADWVPTSADWKPSFWPA